MFDRVQYAALMEDSVQLRSTSPNYAKFVFTEKVNLVRSPVFQNVSVHVEAAMPFGLSHQRSQ
jgi:hypothetical protein